MNNSEITYGEFFERVKCNLCGEDDPIVVYPSRRKGLAEISENEFRASGDEPLQDPLVRCRRCGLEYVNPRIKASIVLEGYIHTIDETFVSQAESRERTFKHCLDTIQKVWNKKPGRILDVGTANGSFLKIAKDAGWDVAGCEPSQWMVEWCKRNYDIDLTCGTIFDGNYEGKDFDAVTLWDVLEHTPDPLSTLTECIRVLKPGGLLVVNYPDIGSWIARLMGRKWVFLLSVHFYYFTRKTIRHTLEKVNFSCLKIKPHFQSLELDYILFRATPYVGFIAKALRSLTNAFRLSKIKISYWVGQTFVIAEKKTETW